MRNVTVLLMFCFALFACGNGSKKSDKAGEAVNKKDRVEVLYFHGKQRCATCSAIEKNTQEVVECLFAEELKDGTLVFRVIDISDPVNEATADKYEVTWSSLFVSQWKGGKEKAENLTEFAFANARTAPEAFKEGLADKIKEFKSNL